MFIIGLRHLKPVTGVARVLYCADANPEDPAVFFKHGICELRCRRRIAPGTIVGVLALMEEYDSITVRAALLTCDVPAYVEGVEP